MHRGLCYVESKFKKHLFFYFFTFKEQPCWLNIPLGFFTFLLFYLFTFLPLKSAAGNSERSSDGCKDGDCNLQNRFPSVYFHNLYFNVEC